MQVSRRMRTIAMGAMYALLEWQQPVLSAAQVPRNYDITVWTTNRGLPSGSVWALTQDANGYIWIGSDSGLVRFDGLRFVPWRELSGEALPPHSVQSLLSTRDGALWVGFGGDAGVAKITNGAVETYGVADGLAGHDVTALAQDVDGVVWAACAGALFRLQGHTWVREPGLPSRVRSIHATGSGRLFALLDQGVAVRHPGAREFVSFPTVEPYVRAVHEDPAGHLWVADRILRVTSDAAGVDVQPVRGEAGAPLRVLGIALLADEDGTLWIGTAARGLLHVQTHATTVVAVERVTTITGLSNDVIRSLLRDRDGNIWVGTANGLNRLRQHTFESVSAFGALANVAVGRDDTLWGTSEAGLLHFDIRNQVRGRIVASHFIGRALHVDPAGDAWVSTDEGVKRYSGAFGQERLTMVLDSLRRVRSMTTDPAGATWFYDLDRGLMRWQDGRLESGDLPDTYRGGLICSMRSDRTGRIWIGFLDGSAIAVRPQAVQRYGPAEGLDIGPCNALSEDGDGDMWILGMRGMARLAGERFVSVTRLGEVPLESPVGLLETLDETWLYAPSGVTRISGARPRDLVSGRAEQLHIHFYGSESGIGGHSGPRGIAASAGRLWFATSRGLTFVEPRSLADRRLPAPVRIDSVVIDEARVSGPPAELPGPMRRAEIDFSLPSLSPSSRLLFRYRLDGFDTVWHPAALAQRRVDYTNLPAGSYQFRVEHIGSSGATASSAVWAFRVRPAFYQTIWFALVCLSAAGATGWLGWNLRLQAVRRQFAVLLKERVRLSREIHDTLLQGLIGVSLQLAEAEHDEGASSASRQRLLRTRRQVEEYIREARESIWNLRSSVLEREGLSSAMRRAGARAVAESKAPIDFQFSVSGTPVACPPDVEEQLLRVGLEAVTNAVRHAHATAITMELRYPEGHVIVAVGDNGTGFDVSRPHESDHLGLISMRERAAAIGAELLVSSAPGCGTEVHVSVPLGSEGQAA